MTLRDSIHAARVSGPETNAESATVFTFCFPPATRHSPAISQRARCCREFFNWRLRVAAEFVLNHPLTVREITKAKFLRPIIPEEICVELKLAEKADMIQIRASFSVTGQAAGETILQATRNS